MESNYPQAVEETLERMHQVLSEPGGFFQEFGVRSEIGKQMLWELAGEILVKKWIETGDPAIESDEEFGKLLARIVAYSHLENLKQAGLVDSIEDETGEEMIWLTDKGKELAEDIKKSEEDEL